MRQDFKNLANDFVNTLLIINIQINVLVRYTFNLKKRGVIWVLIYNTPTLRVSFITKKTCNSLIEL